MRQMDNSDPFFFNSMWRHRKLTGMDKLTGYRATKQFQAKIDGLRMGYERATIKVAHFWKEKLKMTESYFCEVRMRQIYTSDLPSLSNLIWRHQKLTCMDKLTGYRATKQIQAKIAGLRTVYEHATIKVAHL